MAGFNFSTNSSSSSSPFSFSLSPQNPNPNSSSSQPSSLVGSSPSLFGSSSSPSSGSSPFSFGFRTSAPAAAATSSPAVYLPFGGGSMFGSTASSLFGTVSSTKSSPFGGGSMSGSTTTSFSVPASTSTRTSFGSNTVTATTVSTATTAVTQPASAAFGTASSSLFSTVTNNTAASTPAATSTPTATTTFTAAPAFPSFSSSAGSTTTTQTTTAASFAAPFSISSCGATSGSASSASTGLSFSTTPSGTQSQLTTTVSFDLPRIPRGWGSSKPKKADTREPPKQDMPLLKKQKVIESTASSSLVSACIGELVHPLIIDDDLIFWSSMKEDDQDNALIRSAGELYFHVMSRSHSWNKDKARLNQLQKDKETWQAELEAANQAKAHIEKDLTSVKTQLSMAKYDLSLANSALEQARKDKGDMTKIIDGFHSEKSAWQEEKKAAKEEGKEEGKELGFHDFLCGFLAFEPDFDWTRWGPSTKVFIEEFKLEEAEAIAAKKDELEEDVRTQLAEATQSTKEAEKAESSGARLDLDEAMQVSPITYFAPPPPE